MLTLVLACLTSFGSVSGRLQSKINPRMVNIDFEASDNEVSKTWSKELTAIAATMTVYVGIPLTITLHAGGEVHAQFAAGFASPLCTLDFR